MSTAKASAPKRQQFRQLGVLIGLNFVDMMGFAMVLPLLPFYAQRLSATPEMVGALIASFSIAQLIMAPIWGRVSDRYGRRPALMIGLLASALAFLVFGLATSLWLLFLSRIVQGAGGGTTGVAQAYISDTVERKDRQQIYWDIQKLVTEEAMELILYAQIAAFEGMKPFVKGYVPLGKTFGRGPQLRGVWIDK